MSTNGGEPHRPPSKEPPLAFLPTPNDALFSSIVRFASNSNARSMSQGHDQHSAAYRERSESAIFSPSSNMSSQSHTPHTGGCYVAPTQREQVASASMLPNTSSYTDGPDPADDTFWYNLHLETLENFDRERATWKKMTDRLRQDIDKLKAELAAVHSTPRESPSRQDSAYYSTNGKENDKIFFNQNTVSRATEKLREFSVVSPHGRSLSPANGGTPDPVPSSHGRKSSFSRKLPSIHESSGFSSSRKRVSIAEPSFSHEAVPIEDIPVIPEENPMDPAPTTTYPQSPPPAEYIIDAGHTPTHGSARNSFVSDQKTRSIRNNSLAWGFDNAFYHRRHRNVNANNDVIHDEEEEEEEQDGDEELHSPKFLPTTPKPGEDDGFMSALDGKLEAIAQHPEDNEPEVLKLLPMASRDDDEEFSRDVAAKEKEVEQQKQQQQGTKERKSPKADAASRGSGDEKGVGGEAEEEVDVPIRFNRKRSLNFGAQMGTL